jgi:UDP-GlcNAc3NAcA epimerase
MKVAVVIGVRPHYVKLAAFYAPLAARHEVFIVNTGQHFDYEMAQTFIDELGLPPITFDLGISTGSHLAQTGRAIAALERPLLSSRANMVIVIGDTNSPLAGAIAGAKLGLPVAHLEAGIRSFEANLPEETNRLAIDAVSSLHLCPTQTAALNMRAEARGETACVVGDLLLDVLDQQRPKLQERLSVWRRELPDLDQSAVVTFHRSATVRDEGILSGIVEGLLAFSRPIICILHPGTKQALQRAGLLEKLESMRTVRVLGPQRHADLLALVAGADRVLSDSNGVQREALFVGTPCFILRDSTEYPETVEMGAAELIGTDTQNIVRSATTRLTMPRIDLVRRVFGDGQAGQRIAETVLALPQAAT